jgi:hypothetical protein
MKYSIPRPACLAEKTFPDDVAEQVLAVFEERADAYARCDQVAAVLTGCGGALLTKRKLATAEEFALTLGPVVARTRCFDLDESGKHVAALCRYLADLAQCAGGDFPPFEGVEEL